MADVDVPADAGAPPPVTSVATEPTNPTYHISLWDDPPLYVCQVCVPQPAEKMSLDAVLEHVPLMHGVPAVPTLLAANPPLLAYGLLTIPEGDPDMPPTPTYRLDRDDTGTMRYVCLYCEQAGTEHCATDLDLFTQHMQQRHDGRMLEDTEASTAKTQEDHPHGGPPGQTGEHPDHPHGGPPGQTGEHPEEPPPDEEPHPEHPIALPEPEHPIVLPEDEPAAGAGA
jgi:hypothetical protein